MQLRLEKVSSIQGLAVASELSDLLRDYFGPSATVETDDNALIVNGDLGDLIDGCLSLEPLSTTLDRPSFWSCDHCRIFKSPKRNFRRIGVEGSSVQIDLAEEGSGNSKDIASAFKFVAGRSEPLDSCERPVRLRDQKSLNFVGMFSEAHINLRLLEIPNTLRDLVRIRLSYGTRLYFW